jgi:hypothetical protein
MSRRSSTKTHSTVVRPSSHARPDSTQLFSGKPGAIHRRTHRVRTRCQEGNRWSPAEFRTRLGPRSSVRQHSRVGTHRGRTRRPRKPQLENRPRLRCRRNLPPLRRRCTVGHRRCSYRRKHHRGNAPLRKGSLSRPMATCIVRATCCRQNRRIHRTRVRRIDLIRNGSHTLAVASSRRRTPAGRASRCTRPDRRRTRSDSSLTLQTRHPELRPGSRRARRHPEAQAEARGSSRRRRRSRPH